MALLSPGVQVTVIDQSNYIPAATNSVPFILLATASNKVSGAGTGIAAGTTAATVNQTYLITSQRDLLSTYGVQAACGSGRFILFLRVFSAITLT